MKRYAHHGCIAGSDAACPFSVRGGETHVLAQTSESGEYPWIAQGIVPFVTTAGRSKAPSRATAAAEPPRSRGEWVWQIV